MTNIRSPKYAAGHPNRPHDCEEVMELAFQDLINSAVASGWREAEVAIAIADLAEEHVIALARKGE